MSLLEFPQAHLFAWYLNHCPQGQTAEAGSNGKLLFLCHNVLNAHWVTTIWVLTYQEGGKVWVVEPPIALWIQQLAGGMVVCGSHGSGW
jgi:hypothetical protein